jgi:hypothetical protein
MALWDNRNVGKSNDGPPKPGVDQFVQEPKAPPADEGVMDFLKASAGEGFEDMKANAVSTPWISIMQDKTRHVLDGLCPAGVWRNSSTGEVYGKTIEVVPLAFKVIWNEREEGTGNTIANYDPGAFKPVYKPVKNGRGYPKMFNPETGNKVEETFLYAVINPAKPHEGYSLLQANMGSISTFKRWNALLRSQRLPDGEEAPIYAYSWFLSIGDEQAKNANGQLYFKLADVKRGEVISQKLCVIGIKPNRKLALSASLALAAPEDGTYEEVIQE